MSDDRSTTFGARLRAARQHAGLTQAQLARQVGCSKGYMSNLERDQRTPRMDLIVRLATALQVTTDALLRARTGR